MSLLKTIRRIRTKVRALDTQARTLMRSGSKIAGGVKQARSAVKSIRNTLRKR